MFFRLTNPATFQAMMNKLLRDLINIGKVAAFINDVIVGTEMKEGHDEIVAKIIKRLEENDLYMKLEKYKWKVREVGFLGVVIGPDGIKMEEEKMKGVLNWLTLNVMILILRVGYKNNSCIRETQENSIESPLQNSLPYILPQMVYASYYAPYPK